MTGTLAALGVALVLLAGAYAGFTDSGSEGLFAAEVEITPVSGLDLDDEAQATPSPTAVVPTPTPTPVTNREDCNQIRGTDYLSPGERTWYLGNCVNN